MEFYQTANNEDSLINRGGMSIRGINTELANLFKQYKITINNILGYSQTFPFGNQIVQINGQEGVSKGRMAISNGLDKLKFLLDNIDTISKQIGIDKNIILNGKRDFAIITRSISMMMNKFQIGDPDKLPQLYISKANNNQDQLTLAHGNWIDYIMTSEWIGQIGLESSSETDYRLRFLSNIVNKEIDKHVNTMHNGNSDIKFNEYIDKIKYEEPVQDEYGNIVDEKIPILTDSTNHKLQQALNKLNSFGKLNYVFYDIFKPIGVKGSINEKYIRTRMWTDGSMEISGVVGLSDCEHIEWEYGSQAYLRSLNTGNQRFDLKLTLPFNDDSSILWWKPDQKEELPSDNDTEDETNEKKYRYYKPYETERFLRWFGSNYIPMLDIDSITKTTVCSSPILSNDALDGSNFFEDSTNIIRIDMSRSSIQDSTSLSLLNKSPRASLQLINKDDGQYARFIVSGHQQTQSLAFRIQGKVLPVVQDFNHYGTTIEKMSSIYQSLVRGIMYLELSSISNPKLSAKWTNEHKDVEYIPEQWINIQNSIQPLVWIPLATNLIRLRQLELEEIQELIEKELHDRTEFVRKFLEEGEVVSNSNENILFKFIYEFDDLDERTKKEQFNNINLPNDIKQSILTTLENLKQLTTVILSMDYKMEVDQLRERIQTFNNLIVRLPVSTYTNKITSLHIFQDWKNFVDKSLDYLVDSGKLFKKNIYASDINPEDKWIVTGTDRKEYDFIEYYTDPALTTPFIDYSYRIDNSGIILYDRWDFWTEDDFK